MASTARELSIALLGWLLVAPLARLMPRRRDWVAVIGRDRGQFVDNAKYFFIEAGGEAGRGLRVVFVSEMPSVVRLIGGHRREALRFPTPAAVWFLLRAGTTIVDSNEWRLRLRRFLLQGTRLVQLWHGVGFKRIERDKWRNEVNARGWLNSSIVLRLRVLKRVLTGRQARYDLVATTSRFYLEQVFRAAFHSRSFLVSGYPRNVFGRVDRAGESLAWANVDEDVAAALPSWLCEGRRIVLVAPTFRDSRPTALGLQADVVAALDDWCESHRVEFVFKFHPHERGVGNVRGRHLHTFRSDGDLYPLMPSASALVTDYSSIYMDFLLLDRPVLFLTPDLEEYLHEDRQFQFDYDTMTPGPKLRDWQSLCAALESAWRSDVWSAERARLRALAFDGLAQCEATSRVLGFLRDAQWIPKTDGSAPPKAGDTTGSAAKRDAQRLHESEARKPIGP